MSSEVKATLSLEGSYQSSFNDNLDELPLLVDVVWGEGLMDGDVMGTYLSAGIDYERPVYDEIQKQVRPGMVTAVVGAHWGHFVQVMLELGAKVHAFEPNPDNFKELKERCPMAFVYQMAGLDRDEDLPLYLDNINSGNHTLFAHGAIGAAPGPTVKARRLDGILPAPLDFALVDAQGCDHLVLAGMGDMRPPVAIVEHWDHGLTCSGMDAAGVLDQYREWGYDLKQLDDLNYLLTQRG